MSRAKRIRKAKMARRQAAYVERLEKHIDEVRTLFADLRERARFRKELNESDIPDTVKLIVGAAVDPVGFVTDMIAERAT